VWQPVAESNGRLAHFFLFEVHQTEYAEGSYTRPRKFKFKKRTPNGHFNLQRAAIYPTGWAAQPSKDISRLFFLMAEKPSEDIPQHLFLVKMKGLMVTDRENHTYLFPCASN
jgi:hypothetical protein